MSITDIREHLDYGLATYGPKRYCLRDNCVKYIQETKNKTVSNGDIWLITVPKSGTHWIREAVWQILYGIDGHQTRTIGFEGAGTIPMKDEASSQRFIEAVKKNELGNKTDPWITSTHLPLSFCPDNVLVKGKVIYMARNPKDTINSHYHFVQQLGYPVDSFKAFTENYLKGHFPFLPYFPHLLEAWNQRQNPNLLVLWFEEMKNDLRGTIEKISKFLNRKRTDRQLHTIEQRLSFDAMKNNSLVNGQEALQYIYDMEVSGVTRSGKVGDWKNHMDEESIKMVDEWIKENTKDTDLKFVEG